MITEAKAAPQFSLKDTDGNKVALADFKGKTVVLYFYPKDDTPGCTKEAQSFRDLYTEFQQLNTEVIGVSPDDAEAHNKFRCKYDLNFPLLCDPDKKVMTKYGAYGEKMMYGKKTVGVIRSTTVIGPDGKVLKHWKRVTKAETHPAKVLEFLQQERGSA